MIEWKPIETEMKMGTYRVLFDGGYEGVAELTPRGWIMIEESIFLPKDSDIVAYKPFQKPTRWIKNARC